MKTTTLLLQKQNFKFSSAHFLIFDKHRAERLHGHNYQVKVDITVPPEAELMKEGYFIDFNEFKKLIKARHLQQHARLDFPSLARSQITAQASRA